MTRPPSEARLLAVAAMPPMDRPTLGGNHRYLRSLLELLASLGSDLHLVSDEHPAYADFLAGMRFLRGSRHVAPFCSDAAAASAAFDRLLRELRPQVVHVNGHHAWLRGPLLDSRELRRVPRKLFTMHLPVDSVGVFARSSWKRFVPGTWAWETVRRDRSFLRSFDRVISVSERFGRSLLAAGLVSPQGLEIVPNGVDVGRFRPREAPPERCLRIGGAGNLTGQKRFDLLITAFAEVARRHEDLQLQIAGEGSAEASLRSLAERLGVGQRVEFVGFQGDMPRFYRGLDAFVLSSSREAAPYVALEAAACGLPSVLTDVGDVARWFRSGCDALIVPRDDVWALTEAIDAIVADRELRLRLGSAARRTVERHYSQATWLERMRALFSAELQASRRD